LIKLAVVLTSSLNNYFNNCRSIESTQMMVLYRLLIIYMELGIMMVVWFNNMIVNN